jgi:exoribonuclease R
MSKTIKILINKRDYSDYEYIEPETNNPLDMNDYNFIDPIKDKLFTRDYLIVNGENYELKHSYIRNLAKIAGVLVLEDGKTYGRTKNGKRLLYKCIPDDKRLPIFLIPYDIKNNFNKKQINKYVVFEFDNWITKHPEGKLTMTIGNIDILENFYEYQLYCKNLNISISEFNKTVKSELKLRKEENMEDTIFNNINYKINDRTNDVVITVDPENSYDFDDGLGVIKNNDGTYRVTVYISNVYLWLDMLNLWGSFSNRVSTIYLPDHRRPMLPTLLSEQLCSLQERKKRFAVATDFIVSSNGQIKSVEYVNCMINVCKNYVYEDTELLKRKDYNILLMLANKADNDIITSHDAIAHWMKQYNIHTGLTMFENKIGIYRSVKYVENIKRDTKSNFTKDTLMVIKNWNNVSGHYINYNDDKDITHDLLDLKAYIHMTSPIRRLVDLINQSIFLKKLNLISEQSVNATHFINKWVPELEYINNSMRSIKKIQNECNLLNLCFKTPKLLNTQYTGVIFDKIKKTDGTFNYMVFLEEIKVLYRYISPIEFDNYSKHKFKLFIFYNADKFKKKIRIQHI